jgi:hypothetical protein
MCDKTNKDPYAKKGSKPTLKVDDTVILFETMTRDELRVVATRLNVPRGRDRTTTIDNLVDAVAEGKAQVKFVAYINEPPAPGCDKGNPIFIKKIRTYDGDRNILVP